MKHGFALSFNIIFVMLAGVVVLIFFITFATSERERATGLNTRQLVLSLERQLEALPVSQTSSKELVFPEPTTFTFSCTAFGTPVYTRNQQQLVFAPPSFTTKTLRVATKRWLFPFPVAPLLYVADPQTRILAVADQTSLPEVRSLFPELFKVQIQTTEQFEASRLRGELGNGPSRVVLFTRRLNPATVQAQLPRADVMSVDLENNQVMFARTGGQVSLLSPDFLLGAILAPEDFSCIQENAIERLHLVSRLLSQRTTHLLLKLPACKTELLATKDLLDRIATTTDIPQLSAYADDLQTQEEVLQLHDCPSLG